MNLKQLKKKLNSEAPLVFKKLGMECEVFNDNIYSKAKVPNKTKIKTASRILKKLSFKVLGTISEEQAKLDVRNRDQKVEYIPVSTVNSGWLEDHNNVMKLRNSSSKLYLVLA